MKLSKKQPSKSQSKPAANSAEKQEQTPTQQPTQPQPATQQEAPTQATTQQPVVTPAAAAAEPTQKKDEKFKPPSISTVVRKLVIQNMDKSVDEISQLLIDTGWDAADVEKRKSTIATLRTDALAILKIAKECGWEKK